MFLKVHSCCIYKISKVFNIVDVYINHPFFASTAAMLIMQLLQKCNSFQKKEKKRKYSIQ